MKLRPFPLIGILIILCSIVFLTQSDELAEISINSNSPTVSLAPFSLGNPITAAMLKPHIQKNPKVLAPPPTMTAVITQKIKMKKGATLSALLANAGITPNEAHHSMLALSKLYDPRKLKLGQDINVHFQTKIGFQNTEPEERKFLGFSLQPNYKRIITVSKISNGNFEAARKDKPLNISNVRKEGTIKKSLYEAGIDADLPLPMISELIRIFSWDVDFQREIRRGDSFQIMYEQLKDKKNAVVHTQTILYANLILSGKRIAVYRHQLDDASWAYFNEAGQSTKKALMRTPIDGARLSSGFGSRKHPILGYTTMHRGVDFAAPAGTPIYAAGAGTISVAGYKGAYGKYVKIRHNEKYSTAYAHLRGFSKRVKKGARVSQGEIIGFVGTTGRSTGPHLHYEIIVNNKRTNPLNVRMPSGKKLRGVALQKFFSSRKQIDVLFNSLPKKQSFVKSN